MIENLINGEKLKGSQPLPDDDKTEIGQESKVHIKSMQTQFMIIKWAVAKCPSVKLKIMGESVPSFLDSGSMVTLIWQDNFNQYFRPQLGPAEGLAADTHHMFDLTIASGGAIPLSRYVKLDNKVLDTDHKTRLPEIVGWNLVKLAYQEFLKNITSMCLRTLNPHMESILCYFHTCVFIIMLT